MAIPIAEAFVRIGIDKTALARGLASARMGVVRGATLLGRAATGAFRKAFNLRNALIGGLAGGFTVYKALGTFATFEKEMDKSLAIMKGAVGREKELEAAARSAAKTFGRSHEEMAQSYFFLASAGLDASKSLRVYNDMARFAVAGTMSMERATDLLTDSLSGLGWASKDAAKYQENLIRLSDLLSKGNSLANTSVEELAAALKVGAASAMQDYNQTAEQGLAMLMALADTGFAKGEKGGMAFMRGMEALNQTWIRHGDILRKEGIKLYDPVTRKMRDMSLVLDELADYFGNKTPEAIEIFLIEELKLEKIGARAIKQWVKATQTMKEYEAGLLSAGGDTARLAAANLDNLAGKFAQFRSKVADVFIVAVGSIKKALEGVLEVLSAIMEKITEAFKSEAVSGFTKQVESWAEYFQSVAKMIQNLKADKALKAIGGYLVEVLGIGAEELFKKLLAAFILGADIVATAISKALGIGKLKELGEQYFEALAWSVRHVLGMPTAQMETVQTEQERQRKHTEAVTWAKHLRDIGRPDLADLVIKQTGKSDLQKRMEAAAKRHLGGAAQKQLVPFHGAPMVQPTGPTGLSKEQRSVKRLVDFLSGVKIPKIDTFKLVEYGIPKAGRLAGSVAAHAMKAVSGGVGAAAGLVGMAAGGKKQLRDQGWTTQNLQSMAGHIQSAIYDRAAEKLRAKQEEIRTKAAQEVRDRAKDAVDELKLIKKEIKEISAVSDE